MRPVVIAFIIGFGGALILCASISVASRWSRIRRRAADPYAKSFGDYPLTPRVVRHGHEVRV